MFSVGLHLGMPVGAGVCWRLRPERAEPSLVLLGLWIVSEGIDIVRQRIAEEAVAKTGFLHLGLENLPDELSALDHLRL